MTDTDPRETPTDSRCDHPRCESTSTVYYRIERPLLADEHERLEPVGYAERCRRHAEDPGGSVSADWIRIH